MTDTSLAMDTTQPSYQDYRTCKYLRENCPSRPNIHLYLDYLLRINLQLPPPLHCLLPPAQTGAGDGREYKMLQCGEYTLWRVHLDIPDQGPRHEDLQQLK